ncbi:tubulin epsilon and delta complex protein 1 isoform X2 [Cephus cinctus]|uniref:Tubulin epsilon and delta complex protein 1 isoform X2 n=1 Tax=Cephus cinctus TaxID=211228 RepID=A0AAJ7RT66_CEPCN|nr:tubulin epsilon and delta complex protein 1 isoform X2 [Cephus cinctus]
MLLQIFCTAKICIEMSDIKTVIALLCKHLDTAANVALKPEHFRLSKFDKKSDDTVRALWNALYTLSCYALDEDQENVKFDICIADKFTTVKLNFAYLQYTAVNFYSLLPSDDCSSRELILAFAWLLGAHSVLKDIVRKKIASSNLGREYSSVDISEDVSESEHLPSLNAQINNIMHISGKINHNMKGITELVNEKIKLTAKVHATSINASGLPHLSVSEMALTKRLSVQNKDTPLKDEQILHELHNLAVMLDTHAKWNKKKHIFFDWMITVIDEHKKCRASEFTQDNQNELIKFICLLRQLTKCNLRNLKRTSISTKKSNIDWQYASRYLRTMHNATETEDWMLETKAHLEQTETELEEKKKILTNQLNELLSAIPNCIEA